MVRTLKESAQDWVRGGGGYLDALLSSSNTGYLTRRASAKRTRALKAQDRLERLQAQAGVATHLARAAKSGSLQYVRIKKNPVEYKQDNASMQAASSEQPTSAHPDLQNAQYFQNQQCLGPNAHPQHYQQGPNMYYERPAQIPGQEQQGTDPQMQYQAYYPAYNHSGQYYDQHGQLHAAQNQDMQNHAHQQERFPHANHSSCSNCNAFPQAYYYTTDGFNRPGPTQNWIDTSIGFQQAEAISPCAERSKNEQGMKPACVSKHKDSCSQTESIRELIRTKASSTQTDLSGPHFWEIENALGSDAEAKKNGKKVTFLIEATDEGLTRKILKRDSERDPGHGNNGNHYDEKDENKSKRKGGDGMERGSKQNAKEAASQKPSNISGTVQNISSSSRISDSFTSNSKQHSSAKDDNPSNTAESMKASFWTQARDKRLIDLRKRLEYEWSEIADVINRTVDDCVNRYVQMVDEGMVERPSKEDSKWSAHEDEQLRSLRASQHDSRYIACYLGRSIEQANRRWYEIKEQELQELRREAEAEATEHDWTTNPEMTKINEKRVENETGIHKNDEKEKEADADGKSSGRKCCTCAHHSKTPSQIENDQKHNNGLNSPSQEIPLNDSKAPSTPASTNGLSNAEDGGSFGERLPRYGSHRPKNYSKFDHEEDQRRFSMLNMLQRLRSTSIPDVSMETFWSVIADRFYVNTGLRPSWHEARELTELADQKSWPEALKLLKWMEKGRSRGST